MPQVIRRRNHRNITLTATESNEDIGVFARWVNFSCADPAVGNAFPEPTDLWRVGIKGHDLKTLVRSDATDDEISDEIARIWGKRTDRYSELRSENTIDLPKVEMSHIGG